MLSDELGLRLWQAQPTGRLHQSEPIRRMDQRKNGHERLSDIIFRNILSCNYLDTFFVGCLRDPNYRDAELHLFQNNICLIVLLLPILEDKMVNFPLAL